MDPPRRAFLSTTVSLAVVAGAGRLFGATTAAVMVAPEPPPSFFVLATI